MKPIFTFLLVFISISYSTISLGQSTKLMSYNIRYDNPQDGINKWSNRKINVYNLIKKYNPEIIGIQEGLYHQITYLDSALTKYKYIGIGRKDGKLKGEFSPIFYDSTVFSIIEASTFWLSEKNDTISIGWDAALERICTYALFENIDSKKRFWVFNTHFDHIGIKAREMSATLILNMIDVLNKENLPVVFMGDLNSTPNSKPIKIILKKLNDGKRISKNPFSGSNETFIGFDKNTKLEKRIDYIFVKGFNVLSYFHITDKTESNNYISDHLPVFIEISQPN